MKKAFFAALVILLAASAVFAEDKREATKLTIGQTLKFTMDKKEQKDISVQFGRGDYYIICDLERLEGTLSNIMGNIDLLKTNGSIVESGFLRINELHVAARVGKKFTIKRPFAARLRMLNQEGPVDVWMTIIPAKDMKFLRYGFESSDPKPLAVGSEAGKGGNLEKNHWAFHTITLEPGKYDVSVYFKRLDGQDSNLIGALDVFDSNGFATKNWTLPVNQIGREARVEKQLIIVKPQTLIFRVTNEATPVDYIIGIEKATD